MKKKIIIAVCILVFILFIIANGKEKEIRVRVIPNSNEEADLLMKEEVAKLTIAYLEQQVSKDYDSTFMNIDTTYHTLKTSIEDELQVAVEVSFKEHILYNKSYNNTALKNEECFCLYVVIQSGAGDNWWGTVFPKFLNISSTEEVEHKSFLYEWYKRMIG